MFKPFILSSLLLSSAAYAEQVAPTPDAAAAPEAAEAGVILVTATRVPTAIDRVVKQPGMYLEEQFS